VAEQAAPSAPQRPGGLAPLGRSCPSSTVAAAPRRSRPPDQHRGDRVGGGGDRAHAKEEREGRGLVREAGTAVHPGRVETGGFGLEDRHQRRRRAKGGDLSDTGEVGEQCLEQGRARLVPPMFSSLDLRPVSPKAPSVVRYPRSPVANHPWASVKGRPEGSSAGL
jgi:hypothetical protein